MKSKQEHNNMKFKFSLKRLALTKAAVGLIIAVGGLLALNNAQAALIAHFKLDEGATNPAATMVASEVGGWTGTFSSTSTLVPTWVTTGLASVPSGTTAAVAFDSSTPPATDPLVDPYIATTCTGVTGSGARTVAAWIKGPLPTDLSVIVAWGPYGVTAGRYTFRIHVGGTHNGKPRIEVQGHAAVADFVVMDGQWHHVAVVTPAGGTAHDSSLYVDGAPRTKLLFGTATVLDTLADPGFPDELVHIGSAPGSTFGSYGFNGQIDDVRIYDEALSDTQIQELAAGTATPPTVDTLGDQTIILGDPAAMAVFTAVAYGSPPLAYKWKFNGTEIVGQVGASLVIDPAGPANIGDYSVTVTNGAGSASATAKLRLGTAPVEPNRQVNLVGGSATFSVTMPAVPGYTYQWLHGVTNLPGASNPTLALNNLALSDAGNYAVMVTLDGNSATSGPAILSVLPVPASVYAATVLRDSPTAYWRLGEPNGATKAVDATGFLDANYVNFTGVELVQPGAPNGDADTAALFSPGTINYVERPMTAELNDVRAFSLEAWVKPASLADYRLVDASFGNQGNVPTRGKMLSLLASGEFQFRTSHSSSTTALLWDDVTGGTAVPGAWHHVIGTFDGTTKRLYVNGLRVGEQAVPVLPSLNTLFRLAAGFGWPAGPGAVLDGTLDEVAVYGKALSAERVVAHYRASGRIVEGIIGFQAAGAGLTLSWEGTGWTLESTDTLGSGWNPVGGAVSPYLAPISGQRQFYRLVKVVP